MGNITAVIIDDLEDARLGLRQDLNDYCENIEVIGEAEGVVTGLKLIKTHKPNLVFLDINMNDGSGFDILEIIDDIDFKIIFTTASDEYAVKAFKFSALDYLLKPIDIDDLIYAVNKIQTDGAGKDQYKTLKENLKTKTVERIALHTHEKIHICSVDDIIRCVASVNYTTFY
ncbi:MAG: response regulator, partial [Flavobacteriales bacterium]|nr:response regulator [Flavobacteriales bacterium]